MFIMSEKKTEDHALDELLNNMPQFTDKRSKDEIYQQVKSEIDNPGKIGKEKPNSGVREQMDAIYHICSIRTYYLTVLVSSYINND